jgi:hypothetical protein
MRSPLIVLAVLAGLLLAPPALADVEVTMGSDDFTAPQNRPDRARSWCRGAVGYCHERGKEAPQ